MYAAGEHLAGLAFHTDDPTNEPPESKLEEWSSLIGIVTAIVGNILISFALNIQRYAHIRLHQDQLRRSRTSSNTRLKVGNDPDYGTQHDLAEERARLNLHTPPPSDDGEAGHGKKYPDAEEEEVGEDAPLRPSLHSSRSSESMGKREDGASPGRKNYLQSPYWWLGILLMTVGEAGNFLAYGFAPASIVSPLGVVALVSNCIIAPHLLKERFRRRDFWGVVIAVAGAVVVVLSAKNSETKMDQHDIWVAITRWEFETYLGITVGMMAVLVWASTKYGHKSVLIDLGLVGLFGGYTALSTKGIASLLSDTLWRALTFPIFYLLLFVLVATALLQIRYLNKALQRFDSTQVIPTQFVLFTLAVIIGSSVLYRDFESATADRVGKFVGGCILTFLGVYLITSGRARTGDLDGGDGDDDEENTIGMVDEEYEDEVAELQDGESQSRRHSVANTLMGSMARPSSGSRRNSRQMSNISFSAQPPPRTPQRFSSHQSSNTSKPLLGSSSSDPDSPLIENPWASSQERLNPFNPRLNLQTSTSSPILPSEAQEPPPSSSSTTTPAQTQAQKLLDLPSSPSRPATLSRNSLSRITPGPLVSPLSAALTAIVADNLRKGIDTPTRRRRRFSSLQKSRSQRLLQGESSGEGGTVYPPLESSPLRKVATAAQPMSPKRGEARVRSFSTTMADLFSRRGKRGEGGEEGGRGGGE